MIMHLLVIMLFSFLDFNLILHKSDEYPKYIDLNSFSEFLKFLLSFFVSDCFKRIIAKLFKNHSPRWIYVSFTIIDIFQLIYAFFTVPLLEGNAIFFSQYNFLIFLMLIIHTLLHFLTEKLGFLEIYFTFIVSNVIILWSQSILFKYCMFRSIFNAGSLTLQFLVLSILAPQNFKAFGHTTGNEYYNFSGIEKEISNPHFRYTFSKLFGKQDSFRLIFILYNYICLELFLDYWKTENTKYFF